jgi:hypothetical protein
MVRDHAGSQWNEAAGRQLIREYVYVRRQPEGSNLRLTIRRLIGRRSPVPQSASILVRDVDLHDVDGISRTEAALLSLRFAAMSRSDSDWAVE